ncbi:OLC1v1037198C1 [Oldenlandia corymbosa var. corymbosa]|uniref:RING-type E3 ubiquitin transferase n=1 Tax=Oldenlandia corymbosa var. corymbosa TaxID=529605 RepID=A0AAV1CZ84_OLDCO|nr:OLC1v1037198C1 [Oldenlandia corymbosa var. corymbosa]
MSWLINPKAHISISSQRSEDDPLYFRTMNLETSMLRSNEMDAVSCKLFKEILRNLVIMLSTAFISSQLLYMKEKVDGIPYISQMMPSFHAKLLALAAFLMTVTLSHKVAECRKKPHLHLPSHSKGIPNDQKARYLTATLLLLGFLGYCYLHSGIFETTKVHGLGEAEFNRIWTYKTQSSYDSFNLFLFPQEPGREPLFPIDNRESPSNSFGSVPPLKLVSFWLKDVDPIRRAKNAQDSSRLTVIFEGVYLESQENGGQGLMCLVGTAAIPTNSSQMVQVQMQPSTLQDDQILLVLRFPKTFTLTTRDVSGEMKSLKSQGSQTYFDKVHIISQLSEKSKYQFGSEEILSGICSTTYPSPHSLINEDLEIYKGEDYCQKLWGLVWNEVLEFVSTWEKNVQSNNCSKIGPFLLDKELEATYKRSDKLRLMFQELNCEPGTDQNGVKIAMVSAVLRVIQKSEYSTREEMRTGLSSITLSAEGRCQSASGQLCMVGCTGPPANIRQSCHSRITLHLPLTMSINQRSLVLGAISSTDVSKSHDPLMEIQRRSQPSTLGSMVRKSIFQYPSSKGNDVASFSFFADVLSVEVFAAPQTVRDNEASKTNVKVVFLSMGSLFGRYRSLTEFGQRHQEAFHSISEDIEVSGHLEIKGGQYFNLSLSFEGIYDPSLGQMHLIGCRDVQNFEEFNDGGRNLEGRMDCLIEVKLQYSPKNARWLLNPNIRFSINSQRSKEDPFYFPPLSTNTSLISYQKKFQDVLIRECFKEGLSILLLVVAILCIRSQTGYTENLSHPAAYISMVMIGLHAVGFSISLITGHEPIVKWKEFAPYRNSGYDFRKFQFLQAFELCIKFLLLFAILDLTKLLQRVWESRKMLKARVKQLNFRFPNDKLVFAFFMLIHVVGFVTLYTVRKLYGIPLMMQSEMYRSASVNVERMLQWWRELESYGGLVQDFFLLPQIIGYAIWGVQGEPLRKAYYIGFTIIRLVVRVYDYARDPVPNRRYSAIEFQYLGLESCYKVGNVIVCVMIVALALTDCVSPAESFVFE